MRIRIVTFIAVLVCGIASASLAMTRSEFMAQKDIFENTYKLSRYNCGSLKANAKDICISQAKGVRKVAVAELESTFEPGIRKTEKLTMAKANAAYDTAKERCDDSTGNAKNVCKKQARAAHVKAIQEAHALRKSVAAGTTQNNTRAGIVE